MQDDSPPIINVIFSYLFIGNVLLFLLWLPAFIYLSTDHKKETFTLFFLILLLSLYSVFSYRAFYSGIDVSNVRGSGFRRVQVSEGDKAFFSFFSKPIAIMIQISLLCLQTVFLGKLYF